MIGFMRISRAAGDLIRPMGTVSGDLANKPLLDAGDRQALECAFGQDRGSRAEDRDADPYPGTRDWRLTGAGFAFASRDVPAFACHCGLLAMLLVCSDVIIGFTISWCFSSVLFRTGVSK
ncbi:hypothetical protein P3W85_02375 [Cupriavidus basilensis]|uniref:Uncharacterized protein n=1 Tax=Cupriavidus basilensis TaxID=68895 RepID=A0ABT6AGU4_9BURK|nr:hypothetical protein [Cupriavidus basilensis]MDF3831809.1 hypothetical protein [Cupriavidus basilensis]